MQFLQDPTVDWLLALSCLLIAFIGPFKVRRRRRSPFQRYSWRPSPRTLFVGGISGTLFFAVLALRA